MQRAIRICDRLARGRLRTAATPALLNGELRRQHGEAASRRQADNPPLLLRAAVLLAKALRRRFGVVCKLVRIFPLMLKVKARMIGDAR